MVLFSVYFTQNSHSLVFNKYLNGFYGSLFLELKPESVQLENGGLDI